LHEVLGVVDYVFMKIAVVIDAVYPYSKGGREKRLFELTTRLSAMGDEIHIYTMKWWEGANHVVENGVHLHAVSRLYPQYSGRRRSIRQGVLFGLACLRLIGESFDVIDVDHMPYFPVFAVWLVCKIRRQNMIATWHEALALSDWLSYAGIIVGVLAALIERAAAHLPDAIVANSGQTRDLLATKLRRRGNVEMVPPGFDARIIDEAVAAPRRVDVIFVGRLVKDKNLPLLIDALRLLTCRGRCVTCRIVGSGPEESNLQRAIEGARLHASVELMPSLPDQDDVYAQMKAARVFAFPSKREGFGMVVLEALACGLPVVTIDAPANASRHLINDGGNGSVVQSTSASFAAGVEQWLSACVERGSIAASVGGYDWDILAAQLREVYRRSARLADARAHSGNGEQPQ
jgi:glycosyltransferase involved in cell wall biosynthesis